MEKNHPISELMESTMTKIREMVDSNTIVGQPITTADGTTLIPVSKVSFGFASGGSDFQTKQGGEMPFGGGAGAGVKITPQAFIVINNGDARVLSMEASASTPIDKAMDMLPGVIDKIKELIGKNKTEE